MIQTDTRRPLIGVENSGKVIPSQAGFIFSSHSGFRLTAPNPSINITFFWTPAQKRPALFSLFPAFLFVVFLVVVFLLVAFLVVAFAVVTLSVAAFLVVTFVVVA